MRKANRMGQNAAGILQPYLLRVLGSQMPKPPGRRAQANRGSSKGLVRDVLQTMLRLTKIAT